MKQKKIEKTKMNPTEEDAKNLEKEFGEIKEKKTQPETRVVCLYTHCVGGWVNRTVPWNSQFQTGDVISDYDHHPSDTRANEPNVRRREVRDSAWYRKYRETGKLE